MKHLKFALYNDGENPVIEEGGNEEVVKDGTEEPRMRQHGNEGEEEFH